MNEILQSCLNRHHTRVTVSINQSNRDARKSMCLVH